MRPRWMSNGRSRENEIRIGEPKEMESCRRFKASLMSPLCRRFSKVSGDGGACRCKLEKNGLPKPYFTVVI